MKGNKSYPTHWDTRYGDLVETFEGRDTEGIWATKRAIPSEFREGDGVFYWSSSPDCFVVGLGEVLNPDLESDGIYNRFLLSFLEGPLEKTISINELREVLPRRSDGDVATFLKAAAAQTIYPLTLQQATYLAGAIIRSAANRKCVSERLHAWGLVTP